MSEQKTTPTGVSVEAFLAGIEDPNRRDDARSLIALFEDVMGEPAVMWGPSIIGAGRYRYRYDSGHEGNSAVLGFSPRKGALVLYLAPGDALRDGLLARLGKHTTKGGCLYLKRLLDVDLAVLREMAVATVANRRAQYPD
jgi:hypothetical protein